MNLEKGYEMDPIWSGFNEVFREMLNKKVCERQVLCIQFFSYFMYARDKTVGISILVSRDISFCIFIVFFSLVFNDETWMNVESSKYLEKGTIECRNVGVNAIRQN